MPLDTINRFGVGVRGDRITIMAAQHELSKAEALNLAAWLVVLADPSGRDFIDLYNAVKGT